MTDPQARERSTTLLFYGCLLLLGYLTYELLSPFLAPLAWAAILAVYFFPQYRWLDARLGRNGAASVSTAAVTLIIVVPFVLVAIAFVQEASQTIGQIDFASSSSTGIARVQRAWTWAQRQRIGHNLGSFDNALKEVTAWLERVVAGGAAALVTNIVVMIADLVVMLFALFFFFRDGDAIMQRLRRLLPFDASFSDRSITDAGDLIRASLSSGLIVALVQGALGGISFAILRIGAPIFWGVMMAFFALLPLGAGVIWAPVAAWLMLTDHIGRGIVLIAIGVGGIGLVDNVLRPILLSGRTQMNGLLVFISLLGGIAAFGLLGLVLGPIIMATTISVVDAYAAERREATRDGDR